MADGENTPARTPALCPPWEPGKSGNPSGRPKGARNRLGERFVADMLADWEEHGKVVIETVRDERPQDYLKVVASILPKELSVKVNDLDELSDEQLARQLAAIATQLANAGAGIVAGEAEEADAQSPGGVSSLH